MNGIYLNESQMIAMPYVLPTTKRPGLAKSLCMEIVGMIVIVYTLAMALILFKEVKEEPKILVIMMVIAIIRITILIDLV